MSVPLPPPGDASAPPRVPLALTVLTWVLVAEGVGGVANGVVQWLEHAPFVSVDAIGLLLAWGLRRRSRGLRHLTMLGAGVWIAAVAVIIALRLGSEGSTGGVRLLGIPIPFEPAWLLASVLGAVLALNVWKLRVLRRKDVRALFYPPPARPTP